MIDKIKRNWWKYIVQGLLISIGIGLVAPLYDFLPLGIKIGNVNLSVWYALVAGAVVLVVDYLLGEVFRIKTP